MADVISFAAYRAAKRNEQAASAIARQLLDHGLIVMPPSYVDWLATSARDPELSMAARVVQLELDRRGIRRVHRPARPGWRSNPFA